MGGAGAGRSVPRGLETHSIVAVNVVPTRGPRLPIGAFVNTVVDSIRVVSVTTIIVGDGNSSGGTATGDGANSRIDTKAEAGDS